MASRTPDDEKISNLSDAVRWLRTDQRLKQSELAEETGLSLVYVGQIERGERYPSDEALGKIEAALGIEHERVVTIAASQPWDLLHMASKAYPSDLSSRSSMRMRRSSRPGMTFGAAADLSVESLASFSDELLRETYSRTASTPVDTDSAELLAIYQRLGRPDQLTLLGVARSLGRHLT